MSDLALNPTSETEPQTNRRGFFYSLGHFTIRGVLAAQGITAAVLVEEIFRDEYNRAEKARGRIADIENRQNNTGTYIHTPYNIHLMREDLKDENINRGILVGLSDERLKEALKPKLDFILSEFEDNLNSPEHTNYTCTKLMSVLACSQMTGIPLSEMVPESRLYADIEKCKEYTIENIRRTSHDGNGYYYLHEWNSLIELFQTAGIDPESAGLNLTHKREIFGPQLTVQFLEAKSQQDQPIRRGTCTILRFQHLVGALSYTADEVIPANELTPVYTFYLSDIIELVKNAVDNSEIAKLGSFPQHAIVRDISMARDIIDHINKYAPEIDTSKENAQLELLIEDTKLPEDIKAKLRNGERLIDATPDYWHYLLQQGYINSFGSFY